MFAVNFTGCGESLTGCPTGYTGLTFVKHGSSDNGGVAPCRQVNPHPEICPDVCPTNDKPVCCKGNREFSV